MFQGVFLILLSNVHQVIGVSSTHHTGYCQTVFNSCGARHDYRIVSNHSTTEVRDDESDKRDVVITTIIPLTDCYSGSECQLVDFRTLDVIGLQVAIKTLEPPQNLCVELELCDSFHDPIAAGRIIGSYNFHESCDPSSCSADQVCFTQCGSHGNACKDHVAVIGPGTPREGKAIADITSALELPQLLYSTGSTFSEPDRFDYLHQLAPQYQLQVDKIMDIITQMKWRYIAVLATEDTYGSIGYKLLKRKFDAIQHIDEGVEKNCCLQLKTKMVTFKMKYTDIAAQLKVLEDRRAKVVIVWMEGQYADSILDYFKRNSRTDTVYIASDGWSANTQILHKYSDILSDRFIGLFPDFGGIIQSNSYFNSDEFYDKTCTDFNVLDKTMCSRARSLVKDSMMLGYAGGMMSSLQAIYTALNNSHIGTGPDFNYRQLRQNINQELKRNAKTDHGGVRVYTMPDKHLMLSRDMTSYPRGINSTCSDPCEVHQYRVLLKKSPRCCFTCKSCPPNSIVVRKQEQESCEVCNKCLRPSSDRSVCVPKDVEQFSILNGDSFSVSIFVMSVSGIFCNIFVMVTLIRNSNTPIIKASSPQLCYIMLVSLMVLLTAPIIMVSGPGDATCPLQRYIIGVGTVIPIAVLFARTNRINVIFNRRSLLTSHLQKMIMSVKYNVLLVGFFAAIQFFICLALHLYHERDNIHTKSGEDGKLHIKILCTLDVKENNFMMCNEHRMDLVYVWIGYVCAIILATTVVAYKTRRLPTNFNEARYICLVMFVVIVLTISTISTYIVLDSRANIMYQCWSIIVAVYSILGIIYGQKMYVIYVIPEENTHCDTNIALRKFIKQDSEHKNSSASSYSQLLIRHPRHLSVESSSTTQPLLTPPGPLKLSKSLSDRPSTPIDRIPEENGSTKKSTPEKRSLFGKPTVSDPVSSSTEGGSRKLSGAEKRAMFRKGYVRKGKLVKALSAGNTRLLVRDERLVALRSESGPLSVSRSSNDLLPSCSELASSSSTTS